MAIRWEEVVAFARTLPGAELSRSYGRPALKVRGKAFAATGKQDDHFVLMAELDEVEMLMETEPAVFFQTDHYKGWPAVLVRYAEADAERFHVLLERAWRRRASRAQQAERSGALH
jgi:hypothetical protein